jgi:hypothetical protein
MLKNLYDICGPVMQEGIMSMIDDRQAHCHAFLDCNGPLYSHVKLCIVHLTSLDDDALRKILLNLPTTIEDYKKNLNEQIIYYYLDYAYSIISDINLIKRCLVISPTALNMSIKTLFSYEDKMYIHFDKTSCKLLHEHGCDISGLLSIAYIKNNICSMKYLIDIMSPIDLFNVLINGYESIGLLSIMLMDKIHSYSDEYLKGLCKIRICDANRRYVPDDYDDDDTYRHGKLIIECIYIIKYMTREAGKKYMIDRNARYDLKYNQCRDPELKAHLAETKRYNNSLLEYHFKPRGAFTKAANSTF